MLRGDVKKPGVKPVTKPGADGKVEFGAFKERVEEKVEKIKSEITKMISEGKSAEEIANWFCEQVDKDKLGKGNAYFDALIGIMKSLYLAGESIDDYIVLIEKIYERFFAIDTDKLKKGSVHFENMVNRFKEKGLPIEME